MIWICLLYNLRSDSEEGLRFERSFLSRSYEIILRSAVVLSSVTVMIFDCVCDCCCCCCLLLVTIWFIDIRLQALFWGLSIRLWNGAATTTNPPEGAVDFDVIVVTDDWLCARVRSAAQPSDGIMCSSTDAGITLLRRIEGTVSTILTHSVGRAQA